MKEKNKLFLLGLLTSVSLVSPPSFFRLNFIEFSDFLILLVFLVVFFEIVRFQKIKITKHLNQLWVSTSILLILTLFIYGINFYILRVIFYFVLGLFFSLYIKNFDSKTLQYFIFPFFLITFLNFVVFIFQLSYAENTIGWISYFYENPSFFDRGRLSGFQGSGPNVAGGLLSVISLINLYFYQVTNNKFHLVNAFLNLFLVFVTYSRGAYLSLLIVFIFYIIFKLRNVRIVIFSIVIAFLSIGSFLLFSDTKILLKESDRSFLTQIAIDNISIFKGVGPGSYVESIYNDYFLSINPDILEENLNINLNKVELGITPIEYRDSEIDFFIGTSGGGYEILVQSKLVSECSDDRKTCQHVRVKEELLKNFLSAIYQIESETIQDQIIKSSCLDNMGNNITRMEFECINNSITKDLVDNLSTNIPPSLLFIPCEESGTIKCGKRELAVGELAVVVERLSIANTYVPLQNYKKFCFECNFRNVDGYIKFEFDKEDGFLPRSVLKFYTSEDGIVWDMIGYPRTNGEIINLNANTSFLEIGGHSDGQSFGNTFMQMKLSELTIITESSQKNIIFNKDNLNKEYFVFNPNTTSLYEANITYSNYGIELFRPNKYWIALEDNTNYNDDFEMIFKVTLPEIPWERQTLVSKTSIFNNQIQSWKLEIDDGRFFFYWTDSEGVYLQQNIIGDKSLRSGVMTQSRGLLTNTSPPIVDPSFLSQLTTAHNGFLTFSVEFGLIISVLFYFLIIFSIFKQFLLVNYENIFIFMSVIIFLLLNITNDMVYSPDMLVMFIISFSILFHSTNSLDLRKS